MKAGEWGITCVCIAFLANSGLAQQVTQTNGDSETSSGSSALEEITVTARKREERAIDTPISLSIFTPKDIENQQINGIDGIANSVPSLFYQQRGTLETAMSIRGVGGDPRNVGLESGVSVAIDGASVGRTNAYNTDLFQIGQIEVLRGPQGTLFGTNTIGGLINITTVKPSQDVHAEAYAEYGNYATVKSGASASGPLADGLYAGITVASWNGGGYLKDPIRDETLQGHNRLGTRVAFRWLPVDGLEANISADWTRDNQNVTLQQVVPPYIGPALTYTPANRFVVDADQPNVGDFLSYGFNANLNYDFGWASLTSVTAIRDTYTLVYSDGDSLPVNLVASGPFTDDSQFRTQEFRLTSLSSGPFKYVVGIFGEDQLAGAYRLIALNGSYPQGAVTNARLRTDAYAGFANADYKLTDGLTLTAGARYNVERKYGYYDQVRPAFPALSLDFPSLSRKDDMPSWTAGLDYKFTPDIATYATVSTGKKSGGFNVDLLGSSASTPATIAFKPESLTSYETGFKGEFFSRRLSLTAAVFHLDYRDRQVSQYIAPPDTLPFVTITNAGKSKTDGFELDASLALPADTTISASLSHLRARYTSFPDATSAGVSYTGNTTEFSPDYTATVNLDKDQHLTFGKLELHTDVHYQGNTYLDPSDNLQNYQAGYWLWDARVGYSFDFGSRPANAGIYFFGRNLTDRLYLVYARQQAGVNQGLYGDPRMYGVEVRVKY